MAIKKSYLFFDDARMCPIIFSEFPYDGAVSITLPPPSRRFSIMCFLFAITSLLILPGLNELEVPSPIIGINSFVDGIIL